VVGAPEGENTSVSVIGTPLLLLWDIPKLAIKLLKGWEVDGCCL